MADGARPRFRLRGFRQHSPDRARVEAGRIRLGLPRVWRRLSRLDDLVRVFCRSGAREYVSAGEVGRPLAEARLARGARLRDRFLRAPRSAWMASEPTAQSQARYLAGRNERRGTGVIESLTLWRRRTA